MTGRAVVLTILLAAVGAARAAAPACEGTLSGSVTARFECTVAAETRADGKSLFVVHGKAPIDGIPSYVPGAFELPEGVVAGIYTLETLGPGRATVAAEGGTLYAASKTTGQRGEVMLVLTEVKQDKKAKGAFVVHGTYRARLPPAGGGKSGEVVIDVRF